MSLTTAPIALFAFNRSEHLQRTLNALAANEFAHKSELVIFCDGPRNDVEKQQTDAVCALAHQERKRNRFAFVRIVERPDNLGCAKAIIAGLTEMFAVHKRLIVMEDDILCSPRTLAYLNSGLEKYEKYSTVWNIAAWSPPPAIFSISKEYPYDAYAIPRFNCWGWASWRDRWDRIDWSMNDYTFFSECHTLQKAFDQGGEDMSPMLAAQMEKKIDAWDIRMDYTRFKHGCVGLNPVYSYTTNIGMGSGTHTTEYTDRYDNDLSLALANPRLPDHIFVDADILAAYHKVYAPSRLGERVLNKIQRIFRRILSDK